MQDWQETIAASRNQGVASQDSYRRIQASLWRWIDSIQLSMACSKSGVALQRLAQLKDCVNRAWETVFTVKTDRVALLDAVESLASSRNSPLNNDQIKSVCPAEGVYDGAVAAEIRYLDPDQNRKSPGIESRSD